MKRLILALLLIPVVTGAQTLEQNADALLTAYTEQNKFSGNVLIAKNGKIVFQKSYGFADRENKKPLTLQTEFRVGSLTKMFTSAVILDLVEQSKISLDDPLSKFLPDFENGDSIRVKHLLSHTSGIKGSSILPEPNSLEETVIRFKTEKTGVRPGERFEYNNFNYILLSYIAQTITGTEYSTLIQRSVLQKAKMRHSGLDFTNRQSDDKALGYTTDPQTAQWVPMNSGNVALASGAGAMYSNLEDLYHWSLAISNASVLSNKMLETAFEAVQGNYGLGFVISNNKGRKEISHSGSIEGFIANFIHYPAEDITIIFLSNYRDANGRQLSEDLTAIAFNEPFSLPVQKKEIVVPSATLAQYAGTYQLNEHFSIVVSVENNKLLALAPGDQQKVELTPETESKFFLKGPEIEIEFIKENDVVKYMFIKMQGGQKLTKIR